MTDASDNWPEGFLPVRPIVDHEGFYSIVSDDNTRIAEDVGEIHGNHVKMVFEKACRAINAHDKLVEACEAALEWFEFETHESDLPELFADLRVALAAARKPEDAR